MGTTIKNKRIYAEFPCWITKSTNTLSQYVIFIAFALQRWLEEHASMLRYTNSACLVLVVITICIYGGALQFCAQFNYVLQAI